jgi:hypothetical protein
VVQTDKDSGNLIEDSPCSGQQSTSPDEQHAVKVCEVIRSNRCLRAREVPDEASISKNVCCEILTEN